MSFSARKTLLASVSALVVATSVTACGGHDPMATKTSKDKAAGGASVITVGTANFPESEIIGHIWAQALKDAGFHVAMKNRIGSREVYIKALKESTIDIVPEYSGNLAEFFLKAKGSGALPDKATEAQVIQSLKTALPDGLSVGQAAPGQSKDSFRVTEKFSKANNVQSIGDLAKLHSVSIAANPEIVQRPFGPVGLEKTYRIKKSAIKIMPISDSGGPLTVKALVDGKVDVANIYTTSPALDAQGKPVNLVTLKDPEHLILPQHVLPLMKTSAVPAKAQATIDEVDKNLTTKQLLALNMKNVGAQKQDAEKIAKEFLKEHPVKG